MKNPEKTGNIGYTRHRMKNKQNKKMQTQYVLDTTIQTQMRH